VSAVLGAVVRLVGAVAFIALVVAAWESWVFFTLLVLVIALVWWRSGKRQCLTPVDEAEVVVPRHEAALLLGGKSVQGLLLWGELRAAELPSGLMGVTLSSVHRELEWQERASPVRRLMRALSILLP
jgi:hypothetical protein